MPKAAELIGKKVGRLTVIERGESRYRKGREWVCRCECGNTKILLAKYLTTAKVKSCGCGAGGMDLGVKKRKAPNGAWLSPLYKTWANMLHRCDPLKSERPKYVPLGMCDRWRNFDNFVTDMGDRPTLKHSIDRIDNSKGYSPDNCRWSTNKEQCNNKSNNHLLEFNGEIKTMTQWAEQYGIPFHTFKSRINKSKWSIERALTEPLDRFGQKYNTAEKGAKKHHQLPK